MTRYILHELGPCTRQNLIEFGWWQHPEMGDDHALIRAHPPQRLPWFPTARTREEPDQRVEDGGTYALYFLTQLAEIDPHAIARTKGGLTNQHHWDYRYPALGVVWSGPLDQVFRAGMLHNMSPDARAFFTRQLTPIQPALMEVTYPQVDVTAPLIPYSYKVEPV